MNFLKFITRPVYSIIDSFGLLMAMTFVLQGHIVAGVIVLITGFAISLALSLWLINRKIDKDLEVHP